MSCGCVYVEGVSAGGVQCACGGHFCAQFQPDCGCFNEKVAAVRRCAPTLTLSLWTHLAYFMILDNNLSELNLKSLFTVRHVISTLLPLVYLLYSILLSKHTETPPPRPPHIRSFSWTQPWPSFIIQIWQIYSPLTITTVDESILSVFYLFFKLHCQSHESNIQPSICGWSTDMLELKNKYEPV